MVWREGSKWTGRHRRWLATLSFDDPAIASTYSQYLTTVKLRDTLEAVEADLTPLCIMDPFGEQVARLAAYRGVTRIGALCLAAEVFDWRRFPRARPFMSFTGLVPGENSTGLTSDGDRSPGPAMLTSGASSAKQLGPVSTVPTSVSASESVQGVTSETVARSWAAQVRLSRRFRQLAAHKNVRSVMASAIARELAGFLWAGMTAEA